MMYVGVEVLKFEDGKEDEVIKLVAFDGPRTEHYAERVEAGIHINMNHECFYTRLKEEEVPIKERILKALEAPEPQTVRDFAACGLDRSAELKYALMELEQDGVILSRLPMATSPLRLYELVK
jgi:hypothetical protein